MEKLYAVIRKRAVHKATLERYKTAFTRFIVWVMPLKEYNESYSNLKNVKRFWTKKTNPRETSPLCSGTTFNIAEYLVTQNTHQQLSVVRRDNLKYPWFSGPIVFHRYQKQDEFAYFWQAVKRGNPVLSDLLVLGRQSIVWKNSSRNRMVYYPPSWQRARCSEC